ncbi:hypothetical protein A2U01_0111048, partial [Trifolium medium]|nr:hypothetical protein [Trifolium medium]
RERGDSGVCLPDLTATSRCGGEFRSEMAAMTARSPSPSFHSFRFCSFFSVLILLL